MATTNGRIAINLKEEDQRMVSRIKLAIHKRTEVIPSTTEVVRQALKALAKKEKVA